MINRSPGSFDPLWFSIALMPLVGISFLLAIQPQDYWWLLRVGQDTIQHGAIPLTNTISLSQAGSSIVYQPWLAAVLLWLVHQLGGVSLTFLLRGILIGATYAMLWLMMREVSNAPLATLLTLVLGLATADNWAVRAQLFVYPLFVLCLLSLLRWQNGSNKFLWMLPLITLLWANLHGSFVLPLALALLAIVFGAGDRKALTIAFGMSLLASLINPRGLGVWNYFAFMLNSPSDQLFAFEWAPPRNEGWQNHIFFGWILLIAPLAALSPRRLSILEWVWFLAFGWLALSGLRYVIWFLLIAALLSASLLGAWMQPGVQPTTKFTVPNLVVSTLLLGLSLLFLPGVRQNWMGDSVRIFQLETTPLAATDWLAQHPELRGPLWTDYAFGGYLSFALQSRPPWMDSRFNAFPPAQWTEYVQVSQAENWQPMFDRERINLLMLSSASQPRLIAAVAASDVWCKQYSDLHAVIFSRCQSLP